MDPRVTLVLNATAEEQDGRAVVVANGEVLTTPGGNPVATDSMELAEAIAEEIAADGAADVTRPSLYALYAVQRDFIEPDPERTVQALVELVAHDYLLHPAPSLGRRQVQVAAWKPQIELWLRVSGQEPPFAEEGDEPSIGRSVYGAFHGHLDQFTAAQLSVAISCANLLKSATLGMLLAQEAIDANNALEAAAVTPRFMAGESQEELEIQQEREEAWEEILRRLLRYAELTRVP